MSIPVLPVVRETANDRLKRRFSGIWWNSITIAVVFHFLLFAFFPMITAADIGTHSDPTPVIIWPPDPPDVTPPEKIERPKAPFFSDRIDADVLPPRTDWDSWRPEPLPPPKRVNEGLPDPGAWIPRTLEPRLLNAAEVQRALTSLYPSTLRDAGIGGMTKVWFYIDETGRVIRTQVNEPSEYPAFDAAALKVAELMRFAPAKNRDKVVAVWVALPIRFTTRAP